MPRYFRRSGYRRRRYARSKRALSTRAIYGNKSARAQSHQIAALRNRVSRMYRRIKPETKVWMSTIRHVSFTSELTGTWCEKLEVLSALMASSGTAEGEMVGDTIRPLSLQMLASFNFKDVSDPMTQSTDSKGAQVRIVLLQNKSRTNESVGSIGADTIVSYAAGSGNGYELMAVSPLVPGITERYRILYDRSFSITLDNNQVLKRISVRPNRLRKNSQDYYNKIYAFIFVSGLHWTSATYYEEVQATLQFKLAYTDN